MQVVDNVVTQRQNCGYQGLFLNGPGYEASMLHNVLSLYVYPVSMCQWSVHLLLFTMWWGQDMLWWKWWKELQ